MHDTPDTVSKPGWTGRVSGECTLGYHAWSLPQLQGQDEAEVPIEEMRDSGLWAGLFDIPQGLKPVKGDVVAILNRGIAFNALSPRELHVHGPGAQSIIMPKTM